MEDLWKAVRNGKENIRFRQRTQASPYIEADRRDITKMEDGVCQIRMNGMYRFADVICPLLQADDVDEKLRAWLFDVFLHYLTCIAYREGFSVHEYKVRQNMQALEKSCYGAEICRLYRNLGMDEKYYINDGLYRQANTRESVLLFAEMLVKIVGFGTVYKNLLEKDEVLYYAGKRKDKETEEKIRLGRLLFLPLGYTLRIFWETHFGVLGEEQTMELGAIEL